MWTVGTLFLILSSWSAGLIQAQNYRSSCPNGWLVFDESCYYFGNGNGMSFIEAQQFCRFHGSYLVHVNNGRENAFLKDHLVRLNHASYWMGLSDEMVEGWFTWSDDASDPQFTDWAPGQPDDGSKHDEDCVYFWKGHGFMWNDETCSYNGAKALCEKP